MTIKIEQVQELVDQYADQAFEAGEQSMLERVNRWLQEQCECDGTDDGRNYCVYHRAIDVIKRGTRATLDLPKYHCPDCRDWSCYGCHCEDNSDCNACTDFVTSGGASE